jgi:hypothetical protein
MTTSLKDNAYHVLGLSGTATTKQILQRSNAIVQRLKIDDVPDYELDIPAFKNNRTEEAVKDALRRLQAPNISSGSALPMKSIKRQPAISPKKTSTRLLPYGNQLPNGQAVTAFPTSETWPWP